MSPSRLVSDQELKDMIRDGLSKTEILEQSGYAESTLRQRLSDVGAEKNRKLQEYSKGGANFSVDQATLDELYKENSVDQDSETFFKTTVEEGTLRLELSEKRYRIDSGEQREQ